LLAISRTMPRRGILIMLLPVFRQIAKLATRRMPGKVRGLITAHRDFL
jgi:hypothetical protein